MKKTQFTKLTRCKREHLREQYDLVATAVNGLHRKAAWSEHVHLPHALAQTNNYHIPHTHSKRARISAEIVCNVSQLWQSERLFCLLLSATDADAGVQCRLPPIMQWERGACASAYSAASSAAPVRHAAQLASARCSSRCSTRVTRERVCNHVVTHQSYCA